MAIVRQALFHGTVHPGLETEFRRFVEERLVPMWVTFPGADHVRIQFEIERDEGASPVAMALSMRFADRAALQRTLDAPIRMESRAVTAELMRLFDGHITHHIFDTLEFDADKAG